MPWISNFSPVNWDFICSDTGALNCKEGENKTSIWTFLMAGSNGTEINAERALAKEDLNASIVRNMECSSRLDSFRIKIDEFSWQNNTNIQTKDRHKTTNRTRKQTSKGQTIQ